MTLRPAVPAAAAAAALLLAAAPPALAADEPVPAAGEALSALTLLTARAGASEVAVGGLALATSTTGEAPDARVEVTPLLVDGAPTGRQVVPAGERRTVPGVSSRSVAPGLAGVVELAGPAVEAGAEVVDGVARSGAGVGSLGTVSLLGLPVTAGGTLVGATSTGPDSTATKTLELTGVALPSVADLLAALGLDLSALPVEVLRELLVALDLVTPAVAQAAAALDAAAAAVDAQVDSAQAELARRTAEADAAATRLASVTAALPALTAAAQERQAAVAAATTAKAEADAAVTAAAQAVTAALPLGPLSPVLQEARAVLAAAEATATQAAADIVTAQSAADAAAAALAAGRAAVAEAQAAVDAAQRLVAQARALLDRLLAGLQPQVDALRGAVTAVLDDTPLVALDGLTVATEALSQGAGDGQQQAQVTGGEVRGLRVLGTDVLTDVLGTSRLELTGVSDGVLGQVDGAVEALTGTLSEVLSTVPGLPRLDVPAPQVDLLVRDTATGVDGPFGTAETSIVGLQVTLPAITLPTSVALPGALSLPGLSRLPAGDLLTSTPTTLGFGTATEQVRFRAASGEAPVVVTGPVAPGDPVGGGDVPQVVVPVTVPGALPRTGASDALALVGLGLVGSALWLRRRALAG